MIICIYGDKWSMKKIWLLLYKLGSLAVQLVFSRSVVFVTLRSHCNVVVVHVKNVQPFFKFKKKKKKKKVSLILIVVENLQ